MALHSAALAQELYEKLTNEEDARVCTDITEQACRQTPGNFLLILISQFLTKLGDALVSPKITLTWITGTTGAPVWLVGMLVPVRESGSLIPQLFIAGLIRSQAVRKRTWVVGSLVQAACVFGLALSAFYLQGLSAGYAILALLVVFSLGRGFCSVAAKDVLGKTIPKSRRGQLNGWSASAAGLVTVGVGVLLLFPSTWSGNTLFYAVLLAVAGALWVLAALVYAGIREYPGETGGGGSAAAEALRRLAILREDADFRRFVMTRALLMCSSLSAPFYVALAQETQGSPAYLLGLFLGASGLASLLSGVAWGRFADHSSRWVMTVAGAIASTVGLLLWVLTLLLPAALANPLVIPAAYFVLSVAHSGVRVGRKTYVVDLASGNRRTDYVAVSNTLIGVLLLVAGVLGSLATVFGVGAVIAILAFMGAAGAWLSTRLPEA